MKNILLSIGIVILLSSVSLGAIGTSEGAEDSDLDGYAWSSNVGFISFGGTALDGTTYRVSVSQEAGTLSGYAWSPNIGFISFNQSDLVGCPNTPCRAKLNGNAFSGWAKALVASGNDWDGWISLSGRANDGTTYGLTYTDNVISGLMWGSAVVGFIDVDVPFEFIPAEDTCANDIDDDSDGYKDSEDADCDGSNNDEEDTYNYECNNNQDDDNDNAVDTDDVGCSNDPTDDSEEDSSNTPQVNVTVGLTSPSFEVLNLGKNGGTVTVGIEVFNASTTATQCTQTIIQGSTTLPPTHFTPDQEIFTDEASLTVTQRTKVIVSCSTGSLEGSDSVDIILKNEDEF